MSDEGRTPEGTCNRSPLKPEVKATTLAFPFDNAHSIVHIFTGRSLAAEEGPSVRSSCASALDATPRGSPTSALPLIKVMAHACRPGQADCEVSLIRADGALFTLTDG